MPLWEKTHLQIAENASERVHCKNYKVGAVLARENNAVAIGYNGPAKGDVHCDEVGCARVVDGEEKKRSGKCRGSHAELNAIANAALLGVSIKDCILYVTYRPCKSCSKQIVNAGIKRVVYLHDYDGDQEVFEYLGRLGVKLEKWDMERDIQILPEKPKKEDE